MNDQIPNQQTSAAIVILSGGLDSTVALAAIQQQMPVTAVITFNYGQRAFDKEWAAASSIAQHYSLTHHRVDLPWVADLLPKALQKGSASQKASEGLDPMALKTVWVPNRNGIFLNIAAGFAEAKGADTIVFGANAEEGIDFPDNSQPYVKAINDSLSYSTLNQVKVVTPVGLWDKTEIIRQGIQLGAPLQFVWSCYEEGEQHCGYCASCRRLYHAIHQAGQTPEQLGIRITSPAPAL